MAFKFPLKFPTLQGVAVHIAIPRCSQHMSAYSLKEPSQLIQEVLYEICCSTALSL